jgi:prevent-host-death family protein
MADIYSIYDAKARFSELIRTVRKGRTVLVSYRGEPVAEIRPIQDSGGNELARRLHMLEGLGILVGGSERVDQLRPIERRPGALQRFLEERDD